MFARSTFLFWIISSLLSTVAFWIMAQWTGGFSGRKNFDFRRFTGVFLVAFGAGYSFWYVCYYHLIVPKLFRTSVFNTSGKLADYHEGVFAHLLLIVLLSLGGWLLISLKKKRKVNY